MWQDHIDNSILFFVMENVFLNLNFLVQVAVE